jgi:predicted helicase
MNLKTYIEKIENETEATEHTFRTPLENLLNSYKLDSSIRVIHEAKRESDEDGTPDFKIVRNDHIDFVKKLVGYVECKKLGYDLEKLSKSKQIEKYSKTSSNILVTNYREFLLLDNGKIVEKGDIKDEISIQNILNHFFKYKHALIQTKAKLVETLSEKSFYFSKVLREYLENNENDREKFYGKFETLLNEFGNSVNYNYSLSEFCDIYSHSMVYGLFIARLDGNEKFDETEKDPIIKIPEEYTLLIEFLDTGYTRYLRPKSVELAINSIVLTLNLIDIYEIEKEYSSKDEIVVYLYEDFLKEYDKLRATENRKESGVYYTPKEIAKFISDSIGDILEKDFFLERYLADEVKILDFATGTGTFLLHIFNEILERNSEKAKEKILKDIYGFELLFTPYIVAHTNLNRELRKRGISFKKGEKVGVYLTNTLDMSQNSISKFMPFLEEETRKAGEIKKSKDILVVLGNPPYNSNSKNRDETISKLLEDYKNGLTEKKINLDDDYIKFIRFAQQKIDDAGFGVFGTITNNSFLDGITHRKMRESLLQTFDEIYILNLHGNTLKKEGDKNVFDIMVGVSISIFVKHKKTPEKKKVKYFSTLENGKVSREAKLEFLKTESLETVPFVDLEPKEPNFWFVDKDETGKEEYEKFWKITEIFKEHTSGIESQKDEIAIQYSKKNLEKLKDDFQKLSENEIKEKYGLKDGRDWKVSKAKEDLENNYNPEKIAYRPFDNRYTSYSEKRGFLAYPRYKTLQHFLKGENLGLVFVKQIAENIGFSHIFTTNEINDRRTMLSNRGAGYTAPLYLYIENMGVLEKTPNFTRRFQDFLQTLKFSPTPEEIVFYIYARLYSKKFREKYFEFLKVDFPRVPFEEKKELFYKYADFGKELVELHTMKNIPESSEIEVFGSGLVEKVSFKNGKIFLNPETYISGVSDEVWNFEIGSYQVIKKWLDYRKKDKVEIDFEHLKKMVVAIKKSIEIMAEIDK